MRNVILAFLMKEFLESIRDRRIAMILVLAPIIQIVVFGYVATTELRNIKFAVIGPVHNEKLKHLINDLDASETFMFRGFIQPQDLLQTFQYGRITMALDLRESDAGGVSVQAILDGTDANRTRFAIQYLSEFMRNYTKFNLPIQLRTRILFNPGLESKVFMIPGVLVMIIILMTTILTAVAVVREKELGTFEQIQVTPITPFQFMLGKTIPFTIIALMDATLVLIFARLVFDMPIRANIIIPYTGIIVFILGNVGLALMISTISETQTQAMMTGFFFILPMILLSGLFFPILSMPPLFQKIAWLNPLTHFLVTIRGSFIKGAGYSELIPSFSYLTGFSILSLGVSILVLGRSRLS